MSQFTEVVRFIKLNRNRIRVRWYTRVWLLVYKTHIVTEMNADGGYVMFKYKVAKGVIYIMSMKTVPGFAYLTKKELAK